jgi:MFS family permease
MEPKLRGAIITLMVVVAVDVLSILLVIPIVDTFAQSLGASKALIGTQFTVYSASSIFASLVVGKLSDYYGRKKIFLFSALGSLVSATACVFVQNFDQFLVASAFSGLFTGTVGTAYAYVGDLIPDEARRRRYISYITATISLCLVLGPLIGGTVATLYLRAPFFVSAGIALLEVVLVIFVLKNPEDLRSWKEEMEYDALISAEDRALLRPEQTRLSDAEGDNSLPTPYHISNVSLDNAVSMKFVPNNEAQVQNPIFVSSSPSNGSNIATDIKRQQALSATEILRQVAQNPGDVTPIKSVSELNHQSDQSSNILSPSATPPHNFDQSSSFVTVVVEDDAAIVIDEIGKNKKSQRFPYLHASKQALTSLLSPSKSQSQSFFGSHSSTTDPQQHSSSSISHLSSNREQLSHTKSLFLAEEDGRENFEEALAPETKEKVSANDLAALSPWLNYRALLVGGLGTFFNVCTYLGLVTLVPLLLQESRFGVVDHDSSNTNDDGLTSSEIRRISFLMGTYLGCYGAMQVLGMLFLFPFFSAPHRCGVLGTAVIGCIIYGGVFCLLPVLTILFPQYTTDGLYGISIGMALGNALCRPAFPTFLSQIAPASRRAEYMTMTATFGNLAMMIGGQMTWLYTWQATASIFLCGAASIINAVFIGIFILCDSSPITRKNPSSSVQE